MGGLNLQQYEYVVIYLLCLDVQIRQKKNAPEYVVVFFFTYGLCFYVAKEKKTPPKLSFLFFVFGCRQIRQKNYPQTSTFQFFLVVDESQ